MTTNSLGLNVGRLFDLFAMRREIGAAVSVVQNGARSEGSILQEVRRHDWLEIHRRNTAQPPIRGLNSRLRLPTTDSLDGERNIVIALFPT